MSNLELLGKILFNIENSPLYIGLCNEKKLEINYREYERTFMKFDINIHNYELLLTNNKDLTFPKPLSSWGKISGIKIYPQKIGGDELLYNDLDCNRIVESGSDLCFMKNAITINIPLLCNSLFLDYMLHNIDYKTIQRIKNRENISKQMKQLEKDLREYDDIKEY